MFPEVALGSGRTGDHAGAPSSSAKAGVPTLVPYDQPPQGYRQQLFAAERCNRPDESIAAIATCTAARRNHLPHQYPFEISGLQKAQMRQGDEQQRCEIEVHHSSPQRLWMYCFIGFKSGNYGSHTE